MCIRKIVAIDKDGTFTLPEEMMVALGLKVGDTLIVKSVSNGEIVFEKADKKNKYSVVDEETSEVITYITEDELFDVVAKRVIDKNLGAFKKLAE